MKFAWVQWGLPNLAVVITLATMPMVSLALPDRPRGAVSVDSRGEISESPVSIGIETVEMETSGDPTGHCRIMPQ